MKKQLIILIIMLVALPGMVPAQSKFDDVYFVPKKEKKVETPADKLVQTARPVEQAATSGRTGAVVVRNPQGRQVDIDAYNRRYTADKNDFAFENDTLYIDELPDSDLEGRWVNEFQGTKEDYEYAVRLIRFRDPAYAIPVGSPLYWDVVYGVGLFPSWNWNVYDDGMYAYVFPTFSNRLWWDWHYHSWGSWRWGWTHWGWYDPWYDPWWGWEHCYAWHSHRYPPYWAGGGHIHRPAPSRPSAPRFYRESMRGAAHRNPVVHTTSGRPVGGGDRFNYGGGRPSGTSVRPSAGTVVRPGGNASSSVRDRSIGRDRFRPDGTRNTHTTSPSRYVRPSTARPNTTRRYETNTNRRPERTERRTNTNVERSRMNFDRSSFNRNSGGGNRGNAGGGGGGNRGRR